MFSFVDTEIDNPLSPFTAMGACMGQNVIASDSWANLDCRHGAGASDRIEILKGLIHDHAPKADDPFPRLRGE